MPKRLSRWSWTLVSVWVACSDSTPETIAGLEVVVSASPTAGTAPLSVSLACESNTGTAPLTYTWMLGDGRTWAEQNPTVVYESGGVFAAVCQVTDAAGQSATGSVLVTVVAGVEVVASADLLHGEAPLAVHFGAVATGEGPFAYSWDLTGDGVEDSTEQNPTHVFDEAGSYNVYLTVSNSDGEDPTPRRSRARGTRSRGTEQSDPRLVYRARARSAPTACSHRP